MEFGGVFEVGVFRCVVVIPVGFSSEADIRGWGVSQLLFLVLRGMYVEEKKQDLTRQDSEFDERHQFFPRRILLNQTIRDIGRLRKDLFLEQ